KELLVGRNLDIAPWLELERRLASTFASNVVQGAAIGLDGDVSAVELDDRILLVVHPLEDRGLELPPRWALAVADAEARGFGEAVGRPIFMETSFDLLRRPGIVAARMFST